MDQVQQSPPPAGQLRRYWTVLVVSLDVITVYALLAHGGKAKALRMDES